MRTHVLIYTHSFDSIFPYRTNTSIDPPSRPREFDPTGIRSTICCMGSALSPKKQTSHSFLHSVSANRHQRIDCHPQESGSGHYLRSIDRSRTDLLYFLWSFSPHVSQGRCVRRSSAARVACVLVYISQHGLSRSGGKALFVYFFAHDGNSF